VAEQGKREADLRRQLAGKDLERKEARQQQRRHLITMDELEDDLETIERESNDLRAQLESMRTQRELAEDQERALTDAAAMLREVQGHVTEISETNDVERKRRIAERLVSKIVVSTEVTGFDGKTKRQRKKATVDVYFYFGKRSTSAALATSGSASGNNALMLLARLVVGGDAVAA
jgi:chromosome segregation ATPase